jgi:hypothetical protein
MGKQFFIYLEKKNYGFLRRKSAQGLATLNKIYEDLFLASIITGKKIRKKTEKNAPRFFLAFFQQHCNNLISNLLLQLAKLAKFKLSS